MKKQTILLVIMTIPPLYALEELPFTEDEEIAAANQLLALQRPNLSVEAIATQKAIDPHNVAQALLWMAEHPQTPMPSNLENYTTETIEYAAHSWQERRRAKQQQLSHLNRESIKQETGVSEEELDKAFKQYYNYPLGALPISQERIRTLAVRYDISRQKQKHYRHENKARFQKIDNKAEMQRLAAQYNLPIQTVEDAFKSYRSFPYGTLPLSKERILERAEQYNNHKEITRLRTQRYRAGKKARQKVAQRFQDITTTTEIPSGAPIPPKTALYFNFNTPQEEKRRALQALDREHIIAQTGVAPETYDKAYKHYYDNPFGPLPTTQETIEKLAKWEDKIESKKRPHEPEAGSA